MIFSLFSVKNGRRGGSLLKTDDRDRECAVVGEVSTCDSLPNFFLHSNDMSTKNYRDSVIAFVHVPKCGGTTIKECLSMVAKRELKPNPYLLHERTRFEMQLTNLESNCPYSIFTGSDSIGICGKVKAKDCSYFTLVREPYDRLVSLYFECKRQNDPPGIGIDNCVNLPIVQWAKRVQYSLFFFQIHRKVECPLDTERSCEFVTEEEVFQAAYNETYVKYVANQLDKIFAVIGLQEDFKGSLKLLERAYNMRFYDVCKGLWMNRGVRYDEDETSHQNRIEEHKRQLLDDPDIKHLLYPDLILYAKAKEIFLEETKRL